MIRQIDKSDYIMWDEYVKGSNKGTFFHQSGWLEVIQKSYGHRSFSLIAEEDNYVVGILPLILIKSKIFGNKLVSIPYAPTCGPISNNCEIEKSLIQEAINIGIKSDVDYLEIRSNLICEDSSFNFKNDSLKVLSILELDSNPNAVLMQTIDRNKRKTIYKSLKSSLFYEWTNDTTDFYKIFTRNMRDLGSPSHSKAFFDNILLQFPLNSKVLLVKADSKAIYSAFYLFYGDTMINSWSSSVKGKRDLYPTDFGIWKAIEFGCLNGYMYYDFGRSQRESSNYEFKRRWSTVSKDLNYNYSLINASEIPNTTPSSNKRKLFSGIWKKTPISIASKVGPIFRKQVQ